MRIFGGRNHSKGWQHESAIIDGDLHAANKSPIIIGIGITTKNRREVFDKTFIEWCKHTSNDVPGVRFKIFIVDDGSALPLIEAQNNHFYYRFNQSVGIARAKNKCLEIMEMSGCTHFFLSDDDFYPTSPDWWRPYIQSREPHLMYIFQDFSTRMKVNDTAVIYQDNDIKAFSHPRGVLLYATKEVLHKVGGMDSEFGKWGWEHPEWSDRIYNAGLTTFKYMDVPNSAQLFHCMDEHQEVKSTVWGKDRMAAIQRNLPIYQSKKGSSAFVEYRERGGMDIVLTSYFTGVVDPQRGEKWIPDEQLIASLINSSNVCNCELVILHDELRDHVLETQYVDHYPGSNFISLIKTPATINPYFQRWISYRKYLIDNRDKLRFVFCTDATDVEVLNSPFPHMHPGILYTGDEPGLIHNQWLFAHHRNPTLQAFFKQYHKLPILNAGLLGGDVDTIIRFCGAMIDKYMEYTADEQLRRLPGPGLTDMGIFNQVAYTGGFQIEHGRRVNTIFKTYQKTGESWFRHK